jgi:hypothetical protein
MVGMLWESVSLRSSNRSGLCGMFTITSQGEDLLALVIAAWHRMQHPLFAKQTTISLPCLKPLYHNFPTLAE